MTFSVVFKPFVFLCVLIHSEAQIRGNNRNTQRGIRVSGKCSYDNVLSSYEDVHGVNALSTLSEQLNVDDVEVEGAINELCDAAKIEYDFTGVSANGHQFIKNYFDGGTKWNHGSTNGLEIDAAHINHINHARHALQMPSISNFDDCDDVNSIMCCWVAQLSGSETIELPVRNTNVCTVDLSKSPRSNHVKNGWTVYDADVSDRTYCEGFVWSNDENEASSMFKGNTLFEISMKRGLSENRYTRNIPGAPLCGCLDQMPAVTYAGCTDVDEGYFFSYENDILTVTLDLEFIDCDSLRSKYEALHTSERDVSKFLVEDNCGKVVDDLLIEYAPGYTRGNAWWYADPSIWIPIVGKGKEDFPSIGSDEFSKVLGDGVNAIIWRVCTSCQKSHKSIYYKRLTSVPGEVDLLEYLKNSWISQSNLMGEDFQLYSTYDDAKLGQNEWKYCNYLGASNYGFPSECGPTENVKDMWNSFERNGGYASDVIFYIKKEV